MAISTTLSLNSIRVTHPFHHQALDLLIGTEHACVNTIRGPAHMGVAIFCVAENP
jgi:hypothetical protein